MAIDLVSFREVRFGEVFRFADQRLNTSVSFVKQGYYTYSDESEIHRIEDINTSVYINKRKGVKYVTI